MKLKAKKTSCLLGSADAAMQKILSNGKDLGKLFKKEICAISFRYFGVQLEESGTKGTLVSSLQGLIISQPDVLPAQISSPGAEVNAQAEWLPLKSEVTTISKPKVTAGFLLS